MDSCPTISLKKLTSDGQQGLSYLASQMAEALADYGAFLVVDHGIDLKLCEKVFCDFKTFFDLPVEEKRKYQPESRTLYRGFEPFATSNSNAFAGRPGHANDPLERFRLGTPELKDSGTIDKNSNHDYILGWAPNLYAECFRNSFLGYYKEMEALSNTLLDILSVALGEDKSFLRNLCSKAAHLINVVHYPAVEPLDEKQMHRISEHSDVSVFTIAMQDNTKNALKIKKRNGEWVYVNSSTPDTLLVIPGDVIQYLSNNNWPGTLHAVSYPTDRSEIKQRISFQFFVLMPPNCPISCASKFLDDNGNSSLEPITFKEMSQKRMKNHLITEDFVY